MRKFRVSTSVTKKLSPDQVVAEITIENECPTREACIAAYNEEYEHLRASLIDAGIDADMLKDRSFSVRPALEKRYEKAGDERYYLLESVIKGYTCRSSKTLALPLDDCCLDSLWQALSACSDDIDFSITFGLQDEDRAEEELLAEALLASKRKVQALASTVECKIGKPLEVSFGDDDRNYRSRLCMPLELLELSTPGFNPDDIEVECEVSATWEAFDE